MCTALFIGGQGGEWKEYGGDDKRSLGCSGGTAIDEMKSARQEQRRDQVLRVGGPFKKLSSSHRSLSGSTVLSVHLIS